jgi:hypothetical protein
MAEFVRVELPFFCQMGKHEADYTLVAHWPAGRTMNVDTCLVHLPRFLEALQEHRVDGEMPDNIWQESHWRFV